MKTYTTLRGTITPFRPYREISVSDRAEVLKDMLEVGTAKTKEKWNITSQTMGHIVYHNKKVLEKIEDEKFKARGL